MAQTVSTPLCTTVRAAAHPITGDADDYDLLPELLGDAQVVLLNEKRSPARTTGTAPLSENTDEPALPESFEALFHTMGVSIRSLVG